MVFTCGTCHPATSRRRLVEAMCKLPWQPIEMLQNAAIIKGRPRHKVISFRQLAMAAMTKRAADNFQDLARSRTMPFVMLSWKYLRVCPASYIANDACTLNMAKE